MPTYDYRCPTCLVIKEQTHSIKESPSIPCPECQKNGTEVVMERMISLNSGGFIFKSWTESMAYKVTRDKMKSLANIEARQMERYGSSLRLQPNVAGMEVESWSEAKKIAKEAGMNTSSYDTYIENEKHISKYSGVDDRKWKRFKE